MLTGWPRIDLAPAVEGFLGALPGVADVHIWGMNATETALTAHLVRPGLPPDDDLLAQTAAMLTRRYGIGHATGQIETGDGATCSLATVGTV